MKQNITTSPNRPVLAGSGALLGPIEALSSDLIGAQLGVSTMPEHLPQHPRLE